MFLLLLGTEVILFFFKCLLKKKSIFKKFVIRESSVISITASALRVDNLANSLFVSRPIRSAVNAFLNGIFVKFLHIRVWCVFGKELNCDFFCYIV